MNKLLNSSDLKLGLLVVIVIVLLVVLWKVYKKTTKKILWLMKIIC